MKTPKNIQKALETIAGFCNEHRHCDDCVLKEWCEDLRPKPPCYWADEKRKGSEANND